MTGSEDSIDTMLLKEAERLAEVADDIDSATDGAWWAARKASVRTAEAHLRLAAERLRNAG